MIILMKELDIKQRSIGINFNREEEADICIWSPLSIKVQLFLKKRNQILNLDKSENGYWSVSTTAIQPGELYQFIIDEKTTIPDPASLWQPEGVHGLSAAFSLNRFTWGDLEWKNIPLEEYIFFELHVGTFTNGGSFYDIESKLDYLLELGITAIEIMPVAQFPGKFNWGYDGVFPFAVQDSYGGPEALQHLVNACHQKNIAVVLDVVYNHIGPEGNYFGEAGPYFTDKYTTPWGRAINFDDAWSDGVREYFIENALMWLRDFHIDALRLDAVHAIKDSSPVHFLKQLRHSVNQLMEITGRQYYLVVELDLNDPKFIDSEAENGFGMDAQWVDEFHHALRVSAGEPQTGYYEDFNGLQHLAKSYSDAYVYDGQYSNHRKKTFGAKAIDNPGKQFIVFSQNHDHIGNRMLGERSSRLISFEKQKLMAGAVLLSPYLPLLFMGEEFSETNPFLYFISHTDAALVEAVRKGRKQEFAAFHGAGEAPDPSSVKTVESSKLQWNLLNSEPHQAMFRFYKSLIALRKTNHILKNPDRKTTHVSENNETGILFIHRSFNEDQLICILNFSMESQLFILPAAMVADWQPLFNSADTIYGGPAPENDNTINSYLRKYSLLIAPESFIIYTNVTQSS
jgi:maltooligosyltrehalose trehalohydrolase